MYQPDTPGPSVAALQRYAELGEGAKGPHKPLRSREGCRLGCWMKILGWKEKTTPPGKLEEGMRVSGLFCTCKLRVPIKSENKTLQSVIRNSVRTTNEKMTRQGNDTGQKSPAYRPRTLWRVQSAPFSPLPGTADPAAPPPGPAVPPPGPEAPPRLPPRSPARPLPSSRTPTGRAGGGVRQGPAHSASPHGSAQSRQDRFTAGGEGGS